MGMEELKILRISGKSMDFLKIRWEKKKKASPNGRETFCDSYWIKESREEEISLRCLR